MTFGNDEWEHLKGKKVIFIHHGSAPGGAPTSLRNLCDGLLRQVPELNIQVACAFSPMIPFFRECKGLVVKQYIGLPVNAGKKLIGFSPLWHLPTMLNMILQFLLSPRVIAQETSWLKNEKPDLVHLNSSVLWTSAIAANRLGVPVIWHIRETLKGGRWNIRRRLYSRFITSTASAIIAICAQNAKQLSTRGQERAAIVYNGINLNDYAPDRFDKAEARHHFNLPDDAFLVLSLGGDSPQKGLWQICRALNNSSEDIHLVLAGATHASKQEAISPLTKAKWTTEDILVKLGVLQNHTWQYTQRAEQSARKVKDRIHKVGFSQDVPRLLAACDVLVFGGTTPHFPRPVYEAWAMGKPIIAFNNAVLQAEVDHGINGLLVPRDDVSALSEALKTVKNDPNLAKRLGQNGKRKALSRFDQSANTKAVLNIYSKILSSLKKKD